MRETYFYFTKSLLLTELFKFRFLLFFENFVFILYS